MEERFKYYYAAAVVLTLLICGALAYRIAFIDSVADIVSLITAVLGLVVAILAFVIAIMTYSSIDSVNVMTRMEGNVLEIEPYVTNFTSLIHRYIDMEKKKHKK